MKYVILVGDGMADRPLKQLGGRTVIEAARTPNMDFIASHGISGMVQTVPKGVKPGSDVANLALLGYDPRKYFMGRGPLEALAMGIEIKGKEVAYRCNLVRVENGKMKDYSAGHITTREAKKTIGIINKELKSDIAKFYPGVSYRNLMIMNNGLTTPVCTPPHDISGQPLKGHLPKGKGADILLDMMNRSYKILSKKKMSANMIWLWGQGLRPKMPKFPLKGAVITAVDLIRGIGKAIGLKVIKVPGVTGYLDTNFIGKAKYALRSLETGDFVFVHVEAPDEAGHEGNLKHKIKAIELFDELVVGTILKGMKKLALSGVAGFENYKVMVVPDHPTPVALMTHSGEAVPFAIFSSNGVTNGARSYCEKEASRTGKFMKSGPDLMKYFIDR